MRNSDEHGTLKMSIDEENLGLEDILLGIARMNINLKPMHVEKEDDADVDIKASIKYALQPMDAQMEQAEPSAPAAKSRAGRRHAGNRLFGDSKKATKPEKKKEAEKRKRKGRDILTHATDGLDIWQFARGESPESHDSSEENREQDDNRSIKKGRVLKK